MNKYFNLNEKINFLYNKCYDNLSLDKNYDMTGGGNVSSLEKIENNDPELLYKQKKDLIKEISNAKIKFIKNGKDSFVFKRYSDNLPVNMILSKNISKSENDSSISDLLSNLVSKSHTKHILLPIVDLALNNKDLKSLFRNDTDILKRVTSNGSSEKYKLSIKENFFKGSYLKDFVISNSKNIDDKEFLDLNKKMFFQIIHTLGVINNKHPEFSHNNLGLDSIFVYQKKSNKSEKYKFGNDNYKLKDNKFDIKLTNFGKSKITKLKSNQKNIVSDLENFTDNYLKIFYTNSLNSKLDKQTKTFLGNLKSKINICKKDSNKILNIPELLNDEYFSEFRTKSSKKEKTSKKSNGVKLVSKDSIKASLDQSSKDMFGAGYLEEMEKYEHNLERGSSNEQTGGYDRNQVPFKREKNTPFISNDERETFSRRKADNPPPPEPPILAEQKVYDTTPKGKSQTILPQVYPPAHVPVPNPYMPFVTPYQQYAYGFQPNQIPVQKYYNISMSSPVGNHSTINRIYEDMLPVDPNPFTLSTIYERKELLRYFRNMLLEYGDGEEFSISPGPKKTLLSYVRLIELNPYTEQKNPYHGLASDFMLYNAAYPIKYEQDKNHLAIVKNPIGLNVRIYKLSDGADSALGLNNRINLDDFEVLREIKYYEYIRENVLKTKTSPNFITLYLYTKDSTSRLNWDEINMLKYRTFPKNQLKQNVDNNNIVNNSHTITYGQTTITPNTSWPRMKNYAMDPNSFNQVKDLNKDEGKSLIAVTEAPNNNIVKWASPLYQSFGAVQQEVETGYHNVEVWRSILFQLVYSCAVLEEADICFENFSLLNNFYIKDLFADPGKRDHWIYKVNNHEFYIPNYGYLLVVDTNFADIFSTTQENLNNLNSAQRRFKIHSNKLFRKNSVTISSLGNGRFINQFKKVINPDTFNSELRKMGGQPPDAVILKLLKDMYNHPNVDNTTGNPVKVREFLKKFFPEFLHNRVGTLLTKDEKELLPQFPDNKFYEGELIVYQERYGEFKWAIFEDDVNVGPNLNKKRIRTSHVSNPIEVFSSSLYKFPEKEIIRQDVKNGIMLDQEFTKEIYNLDNLI